MQPLLVLFTTIHQTNSVSMTFSQLVADSFGKMYSRCAKICTLSLKICTPLVDSQSLFHNKRTAILFKKLFLWILYYMLHMHNFICQPYDISYYYYFYLMNEKPGSKYLSWALNFQLLFFFLLHSYNLLVMLYPNLKPWFTLMHLPKTCNLSLEAIIALYLTKKVYSR